MRSNTILDTDGFDIDARKPLISTLRSTHKTVDLLNAHALQKLGESVVVCAHMANLVAIIRQGQPAAESKEFLCPSAFIAAPQARVYPPDRLEPPGTDHPCPCAGQPC